MGNRSENQDQTTTSQVSRREFLQTAGLVAAGGILAGCTAQSLPSTATSAPAVTKNVTPQGPRPKVAVAEATSYDRALVRQKVEEMFDGLGGIKDTIGSGEKVVIKTNLTGGVNFKPQAGETPTEYHITHPEVVRAVGELLLDAGAKNLYIAECIWDTQSFYVYGYTEIAKSLNATLINLNQKAPYSDFVAISPGEDFYIYREFQLNRLLQEATTFVSVAKLKSHCSAGVTLTMKNLIGIAPLSLYKSKADDFSRTAIHGDEKGKNTRLPRVIVDLNRARPIHLAVIDGIRTSEGGEGPWNKVNRQNNAGLLLAGKNALATDSIGTVMMGFDPTSEAPAAPFLQSDNYLNLAASKGLGTNRQEEIEVVGVQPANAKRKFLACEEW